MHEPDCSTTSLHAAATAAWGPTRPVAPPVFATSAFDLRTFADARDMFALAKPGFTYSRTSNPSLAAFEQTVAELDGGRAAVATSSGQAAVAVTLLALLGRGGHVVAADALYGGTVDLLTDTLADMGHGVTFVDITDPDEVTAAIGPTTRAVLLESVSNPTCVLPDLDAIAAAAHAAGVPVVVDNTVPTPALLRPLDHGADVAVYSATKFLGGHGNTLGGVLVDAGRFDFAADPDRFPHLARPTARYGGVALTDRDNGAATALTVLARAKYVHDLGPTLSPAAATTLLQGVATLQLRMERHVRSAEQIALALAADPRIARVHHPAVPGHANYDLARRLTPRGTASVFAVDLAADLEVTARFLDALELFIMAPNIGDVRSLVIHPGTTTHGRLTAAQRAATGISESTVRLSIGLECPDDLLAALRRALDVALGEPAEVSHRNPADTRHLAEARAVARPEGLGATEPGMGHADASGATASGSRLRETVTS